MTMVHEANCENCAFHIVLMAEHVIQYLAESHMMETGHIVNVEEVK